MKYLSTQTKVAIVRTPFDSFRSLWASASMVTNINREPCAIRVLHVGGTLRSCQKFLVDYNQKLLIRWQAQLRDLSAGASPHPPCSSLRSPEGFSLFPDVEPKQIKDLEQAMAKDKDQLMALS